MLILKSVRNRWLLIGAIIVACIGLGGAGISMLVRVGQANYKVANSEADRFLSALEKGDLKTAQGMMPAEVQSQQTVEEFGDLIELVEKHRGKAVSHSGPTTWHMNSNNGVTSLLLGYDEHFQRGDDPIVLNLHMENGTAHIDGFRFKF